MLSDVVRALMRRWYVLIVGLLATAALTYGGYSTTPPEYSARGLVLLLPSETTVGLGGNPFLSLGGLEQPAGILVAYFASTTWEDEIEKRAPDAQFLVAIDDSTRGPVIVVDVTDSDPAATLATLNFITEQIPIELDRLQQRVETPDAAMITSMQLVIDERAKEDTAATTRIVIAAAGAGIVLTGIMAFILDGFLSNRPVGRRRKNRSPQRPRTSTGNDSDHSDADSESTETDLTRQPTGRSS